MLKTEGFGAILEVEMTKKCTALWREAHLDVKSVKNCRVAGGVDCASTEKSLKHEGFAAFSKTMAGVGDLKRICTDAFFVAGAVQEASSAEMFGAQGADFLRGVAFWRIKSSAMPRCFFVTGAAFRMTWTNFVVAGAVL